MYNIDCDNVNAVVFLDFKKTFDTVDREILLSKLNAFGILRVIGLSLLVPLQTLLNKTLRLSSCLAKLAASRCTKIRSSVPGMKREVILFS